MTDKELRKAVISKKVSGLALKTFDNLTAKRVDDRVRIAPITSIHKMLTELGISHYYGDSVNTVEYRSKGKNYVNSRHQGKKGKIISISVPEEAYDVVEWNHIRLDSSSSYYSANGTGNAGKIINYLKYHLSL
jgi:hypothetical protein